MVELTANERALAKRGGGSVRLFAHRLATLSADEVKRESPALQEAWAARHGSTPAASTPLAKQSSAAAAPAKAPAAEPLPQPSAAAIAARQAEEREKADIAEAAARSEVRRKAEDERIQRQNAADRVWARVYGAEPRVEKRASPEPMDEAARRRAASDAVWDRANSRLAASRGGTKPVASVSPTESSIVATVAQKRASSDAVWDRVNAKREALRASYNNGGRI